MSAGADSGERPRGGEAGVLSLIVPIYKSEANLERLLPELARLDNQFHHEFEVVFVVDGSPDNSLEILRQRAQTFLQHCQIACLTRNFGSFNAILAGLELGRGEYFAVLAADLQEPPHLILEFYNALRRGDADIVFGYRSKRSDPWVSEITASLFWGIYRRFVVKDIPRGGVDIFGCTRRVRDRVLSLPEFNSSLIALLFWLGFRRRYIGYERQPRREGSSTWTIAKKLRYCLDSIFGFTDLPIRILLAIGGMGTAIAIVLGTVIVVSRFTSGVPVRGYTALALMVLFFGSLMTLGMGIVGQYVWLNLQNVRGRPNYLIDSNTVWDSTILEREPVEVGLNAH
ncbi:MAG: glycosyltransferase family 2 protein [Bryobacterales bacterium]|nr:glycosyltransferase family 2 protein [Bryobacterales bacterium]MBV9398571.1 glycosyltransferase family 2 protein [Bryobacterales bacterium]